MDNTGDNLMHEYHNYSSFNPKGPGPRARDGVLVPWSPRPRSAWQLRKKSGAAVMCKTFCFSHKSFVVSLLYLFIDFLDFWTDFFLLSPSRFFVDYFCFRRFFSSGFFARSEIMSLFSHVRYGRCGRNTHTTHVQTFIAKSHLGRPRVACVCSPRPHTSALRVRRRALTHCPHSTAPSRPWSRRVRRPPTRCSRRRPR